MLRQSGHLVSSGAETFVVESCQTSINLKKRLSLKETGPFLLTSHDHENVVFLVCRKFDINYYKTVSEIDFAKCFFKTFNYTREVELC